MFRVWLGVAVLSLRFRAGPFAASLVSVFLGAVVLMSFASLLDSADGPGVSPGDKGTLTTMALVTGGWGLLIVAFGVASTAGLSVRQRGAELARLRAAGATPGQVGQLVVCEIAVVTAVGAVAAWPAALLTGRALLAALQATHQVAGGVAYHFGVLALGVGLGDTVAAAAVAAATAARRAASPGTRAALAAAEAGQRRLSRALIRWACVFLLAAASCAVVTATAVPGRGYTAMALAGQACIHASIALALLAPALMRAAARLLGRPLRLTSPVSGYLAGANLTQRPDQAAGLLRPAIVFTGLAAGSLCVQSVMDRASAAARLVSGADDNGVRTLDFVIVAMITVFAAVVLVNSAVAATSGRRREFALHRLAGATRSQVLRMVALESLATAVTGLVAGTAAALAGLIPYTIARTHQAVPHPDPWICLGVAAVVVALTVGVSVGAALAAMREPAVESAAAPA